MAIADEQSDRRLLMGLSVLPAIVAADQDLAEKRSKEGQIRIVVIYHLRADIAEQAAKRLAQIRSIKEFSLRVEILPYARLAELDNAPPAALMLVEPSTVDLNNVVKFGIDHHRIVFSPFKDDVRAGASAGIFVGDRILPLVNPATLKAAEIRLKPFLLEVARTHE
jgi:hypothetical protein